MTGGDIGLLAALASALLAGFAGSGHCLAMCGGMAGLLSARRDANGKPVRRTATYNAGRIASYALAGSIAGALGQSVGIAAGLDVAAGHLRLLTGAIIVLAGLYLLTGKKFFAPFEKLGERAWNALSPLAVRQLKRDGTFATFSLGMLWGWLPCGLTWSMLAIAAASASPLSGCAIMFAFGLGTLPAMLAAGLAGFRLRGLLNRVPVRRAAAVILIATGVWTAVFPLVAQHVRGDEPDPGVHHHVH